MKPRMRQLTLLLFFMLLHSAALGEVAPAKPFSQLVAEVTAFLFSDVGRNGIRTNDNDPAGYPVPPYFYSYAVNDGNNLNGSLVGYPGYLSVSYPAYTACVAIDAFLDWRVWSGEDEGLVRAQAYADWILEHRTPVGDVYGNLPYSTQTDGVMGGGWDGAAIMTDKPPMFGLRLLRLFDITGQMEYWDAAVEIADVMAATQLSGSVADQGRWPFRVVPVDGSVTQDYTSHLMPAVRFFDAMAMRTGNPTYTQTRDDAWTWLLNNPCDPTSPSYMRWEAFYEDQTPAQQTGFGDHYSGHEMIVELTARQPSGWQDMAIAILDSLSARYLVTETGGRYGDFVPITLEWMGWPEGTYASSMQYSRTALLLHAALAGDPRQDDAWRTTALTMADACSHGQNDRDNAADGRMFTTVRDLVAHFNTESWYEQNFNTVIYFLKLMALETTLAPSDEVHVLEADQPLSMINYSPLGSLVTYTTAAGAGTERLKMPSAPGEVLAGGVALPELGSPPNGTPGWYYDSASSVLTVYHGASPVVVTDYVSAVDNDFGAFTRFQLRARSKDGFGLASITVVMPQDGPLSLAVYDLRGALVQKLATDDWAARGEHQFAWTGRDRHGRMAPSGVYFVRGQTGNSHATARLMLVR